MSMQNETEIQRGTRFAFAHPTRQPATLHSCLAAAGCVSEARSYQSVWFREADGTEHTMYHVDAWQWVVSRLAVPA